MKLGGQINRSANSFNNSLNVKIGENSCGKLHDLLKTLLQNRTLEVKKIIFIFIFNLRLKNFLFFRYFNLRDVCFHGNRCISYKICFRNTNILICVCQNKTDAINTIR